MTRMSAQYRVRVRQGDFEVEVESSDESYVERKLNELLADVRSKAQLTKPRPKSSGKRPVEGQAKALPGGRTSRPAEELLGLVQYIQQRDEFRTVSDRILSQRSQLPRILMCLFYAERHYDDPYLTTGEIEDVTTNSEFASGAPTQGEH